eukprot:3304403-Prymnesium_polylepis.1
MHDRVSSLPSARSQAVGASSICWVGCCVQRETSPTDSKLGVQPTLVPWWHTHWPGTYRGRAF